MLFLLALAVGCADSGADSRAPNGEQSTGFRGEYPIEVVATVGMVADIVRNVGGEHVDVRQMMGSGVDPHLYKATRDDVRMLTSADAVFYNGLMLEGKLADTLVKIARKKPVVAVTESLDESMLLEPDDLEGHYDPHVWMDVSAWARTVDVVENTLSEFDPEHAAEYEANAETYLTQLAELHDYGRRAIESIPEESRILITSHDAFNYFGRAYNLDVQGVQGLSTESEAGLQRVNALVDLLVKKDVKAVFVESSVPPKNIEAIIEGARSKGHEVNVGGTLYSDAMGEVGTYEGTYVGMLDHNITRVTRALGGEAPERGFQGTLTSEAESGE